MLFSYSTFIVSWFFIGKAGHLLSLLVYMPFLCVQAWNLEWSIVAGDEYGQLVSLVINACLIRGIAPYVVRLIRGIANSIRPHVAAARVEQVIRVLRLSYPLLMLIAYLVLSSMTWMLLLALPGSMALAFLVVFGPLIILFHLGVVLNAVLFVADVWLGQSLVGQSRVVLVTMMQVLTYPLNMVYHTLNSMPRIFYYIFLLFANVSKFCLMLSVGFWSCFYRDALFLKDNRSTNKDYFLLRLGLAWIVFLFSLLGFEILLFLFYVSVFISTFLSFIYVYVQGFGFVHRPLMFVLYALLRFWSEARGLSLPDIKLTKIFAMRCILVLVSQMRGYVGDNNAFLITVNGKRYVIVMSNLKIHERDDEVVRAIFRRVFLRVPSFFYFFLFIYVLCFICVKLLTHVVKVLVKPFYIVPLRVVIAFRNAAFVFLIPTQALDVMFAMITTPVAVLWQAGIITTLHKYLRMLGLSMMYGYSYLSGPIGFRTKQQNEDEENLSKLFVRSWVSLVRRSILRFIERMDAVRLPEMIQSAYRPPDLESIRSTYSMLGDMGFAVDQSFMDSLQRPESSPYLAEWGAWKKWMLGTSNFALGFRKLSTTVQSWLPNDFYPEIPGYIHSGTFTGVAEEITSTARYWNGTHLLEEPDGFQALYDDLWEAVKVQYGDSKLATFDEIYRKWTKRFNMGFGFGRRKKSGKLYQLSRQAVIDAMGGKKPFLKAWEKVFYNAQKMLLPSPVFTKWETLKLKKALSRSVRTVVGSAFTHHVMTTVFNYHPNHNYHPWDTPMKVGMPLNGQNFNRVWESLLGYEKVWAGDMTAFDSSQTPFMLRMVAEIRKRGYSLHQDYDKICQLIDISYEMLIKQPMGFKNFGDITFKDQGATTGHSSTTPDNSMMLVANYLFAWRYVTGLRAREFFNFNSLSNFGDDHVLAYDPVFGWSPQAAIAAMKKLGTVMRDEAPGQDQLPYPGMTVNGETDPRLFPFSFLSKKPIPMDGRVSGELRRAGVTCSLTFATVHDRNRLLGKIKGLDLVSKRARTLASYDALISYLYLTAHQKDIYDKLISAAVAFHRQNLHLWLEAGVKPNQIKAPPSYNQVLRAWYSGEPFPYSDKGEDVVEGEDEDELNIIMQPDPFASFVRWLADFPTLLSPRYSNTRWADWVQRKCGLQLSWPLTFIAHANQTINDAYTSKLLMARSPYSFLRNDTIRITDENFGVLLTRHWTYMAFTRIFTRRKFFSLFDLVRAFDSAYINGVFIATGRISSVIVELDLHILETIIIFLLNYLHIDLGIPPIMFDLLSPSIILARLLSSFMRYVTPAGAIDFQPFDEAVRRLTIDLNGSFALQAPTGVGKSTRMMARLVSIARRRVIVIVPRHIVAVGVGQYMQSMYPDLGVGISTEGFRIKDTDVLIYCTAQAYLLNPVLRLPGSIVVLDEAHIDEAHYIMVKRAFEITPPRRIFVTATPLDFKLPLLTLPANNQNTIVEAEKTVDDLGQYIDYCIAFANDRVHLEKILIFVPTLAMMETMSARIKHKVCLLSSQDRNVDDTATVFISTSVADAGLTIPDVQFVFSSNVDIFIEHDMTSKESIDTVRLALRGVHKPKKSATPKYFRLPETTIKQRRGRTGRTTSGSFFLFLITEIETFERKLNAMDFLNEARLDFKELSRFIPGHYLRGVDTSYLPTLFDMIPGITFETITSLADRVEKEFRRQKDVTMDQKLKFLVDFIQERLPRYMADEPFPVDPYQAPVEIVEGFKPVSGETVNLDALARDAVKTPVPKALGGWRRRARGPDVGLLSVHPQPREPQPFTLQDVSGDGLYCGARNIIGVYYSLFNVILPLKPVIELIKSFHPPGFAEDYMTFFSVDQLMAAFARLGIDVTVYNGEQSVPSLVPNRSDLPFSAVVHLDQAHYRYEGIPFPLDAVNITDSLSTSILAGNEWVNFI